MVLIEDILEVPRNCIVNRPIPKKEVFEAGNLNSADKRIFTDLVKQIKWCYNFTEDNIRVSKYSDDIRNYEEVELINITLKYDNVHKIDIGKFKEDDKIDRIADIMMRFIPYPIILTIQYDNELKFYAAHIRESKADYDKIVIGVSSETEKNVVEPTVQFAHEIDYKALTEETDLTGADGNPTGWYYTERYVYITDPDSFMPEPMACNVYVMYKDKYADKFNPEEYLIYDYDLFFAAYPKYWAE